MTVLDTAGLLLFIFYAVSFTKEPLALLIPESAQSWVTRLWALFLGVFAALVDSHFGSNAVWTGPAVYNAIKEGGAAAVGAIITYHIGNGDFVSVFDNDSAKAAAKQDDQPAVVPPAKEPIIEGTIVQSTFKDAVATSEPAAAEEPSLTPAQKAGLVDLGAAGVNPLPVAKP